MSCKNECIDSGVSCLAQKCRHWIDYDEDYNCSLVSADKGPLTLDEISKRMGLSLVRVKQIEDKALVKLKKRVAKTLHE
jgi:hypothetical protein